jgi:hypothetical protein
VARIDTRYLRGEGRQTGYVAQHLDGDGRVLAEDVLYAYAAEGGCGGHAPPKKDCHCDDDMNEPKPVPFKAMLRDTAPGACLRIAKRGETVWECKGAERPPQLGGVKAVLTKTGDLTLTWKTEAATKESVEVWVRWTADEGQTWHALTVGLRGGSATIPAEQLPTGSVRFELLAHDGFYTVRATTEPVLLPPRAPAVTILYPADGAAVFGDRLIHLWGAATSHTGAAIGSDAYEWSIDDKPVGRGHDLWVDNPGAGRHTLRLLVREGALQGVAAQGFEVIASGGPQIG